jgi:predicted TIM-barrel fold metal-dependent hydrolase
MRDVAGAVAELERAVTKLGHRGVGISVAVDGKPLDHPDFEPLFECAARLEVPVLILPNHPSLIDGAIGEHGWLTGAFGFQVDLSLVALRLLASGRLEKYPRLPVILANLGGVFPFIIERLEGYWDRVHAGERPLAVRPIEALRRYYLETASGHPAAIRMTAEVMGIDRLVFGSDYPSFDFVRALRSVRECGLPSDQIALILGGNAERLVRR